MAPKRLTATNVNSNRAMLPMLGSRGDDTFGRENSDDWFDLMEQRQSPSTSGPKCPICGLETSKAKFCPQTGQPHADVAISNSHHSSSSFGLSSSSSSAPPARSLDPETVLKQIPLFSGVSGSSAWNALASAVTKRTFQSGQQVFRAGEQGSSMYIVLSGRVELRTSSHTHLSYIEQGKHFGEIAMLYGGTRNASAVAEGATVLGMLDRSNLEHIMSIHGCREDVMKNAQHIQYVKQWFISNVPLFLTCSSNRSFIDKIASSLQYRSFPQGSMVIRQGDIGTEMYFIVSGSCDVLDNRRKLSQLDQGKYFGEVAMLFGGERTANIKARVDCHMYVLTKVMFDAALDQYSDCIDAIYGTAQETRYLKEYFIKKLPLFQALRNNQEFVMNMGDALHSKTFLRGEYVARQGSSGTSMFFIARGEVSIEKDGREVAKLCSGDHFGELSLLYDEPRSASIKAVSHVHTYELAQDAFEVIAIAFPDWWQAITRQGALFERVDRSRVTTQTQHHGLVIPDIQRAGTSASVQSHTTRTILNAESGNAADREALRRQLREQGRSQVSAADRLQELEQEKLCIVCMDAEKCMALIPCGHICCCPSCSQQLSSCPQCRSQISTQVRVHA